MKNLLQKFNENKKLKNRAIALVSTTLAFALFLSSVAVYQKSKQNIKVEGNKNQNALEETLKNEQSYENAESKNLSDAAAENFENESSSDLVQDSDKDISVPDNEKTSEPSTQMNSTTGKKPNNTTQNNVNPTKPATANSTTEPDYYTTNAEKYCENGNHQWGSWVIEDGQKRYRCCTKCPEQENNENWEWKPEYHMGNKSEYLEFLGYVNKARREAGLKEVKYADFAQEGANVRAVELTQKFSHTRPNGKSGLSAVGPLITIPNLAVCCENIASGCGNANIAFNAWMNSPGHRDNIMSDAVTYIVVARCGGYYVMLGFNSFEM